MQAWICLVTGGFWADCEVFLHEQKYFTDSGFFLLSSSSYSMFTLFKSPWQQPRTRFKIPKSITDACLADVLLDLCVVWSPGMLSYLPWLLVNVFMSGCIFLDCASDFLKEQMVLFSYHQLARRGQQPRAAALSASFMLSCLSLAVFVPLCPLVQSSASPVSPSAWLYTTAAVRHWRDVWPAEQIGSDICQTWGDLVGQSSVCPPACLSACMCVCWLDPFRCKSWCEHPRLEAVLPHRGTHTALDSQLITRRSLWEVCVCVQGRWGLWTVWYLVCHLVHKMKLQAKSQYLIMLILANLTLLPWTATFHWFGRGTQHCSLAEINPEVSSGKYIHPLAVLQTQFSVS